MNAIEEDSLFNDTALEEEHLSLNLERRFSDEMNIGNKVLSVKEVNENMTVMVEAVSSVIDLPVTLTRILLNFFKWDKERFLETFFNCDQKKLFKDVQIVFPIQYVIPIPFEEFCAICHTECRPKLFRLTCNHVFCQDCFKKYLSTKIMDDGMSNNICCAASDCDILVDDKMVMKLISDETIKSRYQQLVINNFVECNRNYQWCPAKNCNRAIENQAFQKRTVICLCKKKFCFGCLRDCHQPIDCKVLKGWDMITTIKQTSGINQLTLMNTKACPKCNIKIEKNGGCNYMICKRCHFSFCWTCLKSTENHVDCNIQENNINMYDRNRAIFCSQRFEFYLHRYLHHMNSLKLEKNFRKNIELLHGSPLGILAIIDSIDILFQCHSTLMNTYAFAYFLSNNNQSTIFEDNQEDLARSVGVLSKYWEQDIWTTEFKKIKNLILRKSSYCETRRNVLLQHIYDGYENNWWEFEY